MKATAPQFVLEIANVDANVDANVHANDKATTGDCQNSPCNGAGSNYLGLRYPEPRYLGLQNPRRWRLLQQS